MEIIFLQKKKNLLNNRVYRATSQGPIYDPKGDALFTSDLNMRIRFVLQKGSSYISAQTLQLLRNLPG